MKKTEEMQGFFKKAMLAYFVICGIGAFVAVSPTFSVGFVALFLLGTVFFPIVWVKYITKIPVPENSSNEEKKIQEVQ